MLAAHSFANRNGQGLSMTRVARVAFILAIVAYARPASASLITYTEVMSTFSHDSDVVSASFNAALGGAYTHISFAGASSSDGSSYSPDVTLSTKAGVFGGADGPNINFDGSLGEVGPFGSWDGVLNIDFLANGFTAGAVGFGMILFNSPVEQIRIYNELNALVATFNNQLADPASLWGVAGNAGERIGRVELDGNFFAIQDLEYTADATVPEPASMTLLGLGAISSWAYRRRLARQK